ncbi:glycosyltransferase [Marinilabilia sp.]
MGKKISIITVTYQSARTLSATIDSVRRQTFKDFEYIVVDGGSTDDTIDILKKNSDVVDKWISEPDGGIYDAMNKGIGLSEGELVGFIHADDVFAKADVLDNIDLRFKGTYVIKQIQD